MGKHISLGFGATLGLLLCLLSVELRSAEQLELVINDTNAPPFTTDNGEGFLDAVAGEALRRVGARLNLVKLPAERALINADRGVIDGDLTRIEGLEKLYPNLVRVPEKLVDWEFVAFSKDPYLTAKWANFHGRPVGHITGWKIYEKALQGQPLVVSANGPAQLFELLSRDRIDVALNARWMGQYFIQQQGLQGLHQLEPPLAKREMFIYLHKKHIKLAAQIAQALRELKQEGFYQREWDEKIAPYSTVASSGAHE